MVDDGVTEGAVTITPPTLEQLSQRLERKQQMHEAVAFPLADTPGENHEKAVEQAVAHQYAAEILQQVLAIRERNLPQMKAVELNSDSSNLAARALQLNNYQDTNFPLLRRARERGIALLFENLHDDELRLGQQEERKQLVNELGIDSDTYATFREGETTTAGRIAHSRYKRIGLFYAPKKNEAGQPTDTYVFDKIVVLPATPVGK